MLGRSIGSSSLEENDDSGISRMSGKQSGFRVRLPSPFMLAIVVVFVVLPLVWPDNGDETSNPKPIAAFELVADVKSLDISQDGRKVAATCRDSPIDVWMREQPLMWRRTLLPEHRLAGSRCLAFSPDGNTLAVGNVDGTVSFWNLNSGTTEASLDAGSDMVTALAFSTEGTFLATASADSRVLLWDVAGHRLRTSWEGHHGPATALVFSPDGRHVASGSEDPTVRLWAVDGQHPPVTLQGHTDITLALAFSPDSRMLASSSLGDYRIRLWDVETGKSRKSLIANATPGAATITCLAFTPDGTLMSGNEHGTVSFWNLATHRQKTRLNAHQGWVKSFALSADGKTLATGGNDGFVKIWNMADLLKGH
jgi:WD40 repeat protein